MASRVAIDFIGRCSEIRLSQSCTHSYLDRNLRPMNPNNLVIVDVETSGLNPFLHQVLAIGLCPLGGQVEPSTVYVKHETINWSARAKEYFPLYQTDWERYALAPAKAAAEVERFFSSVSSSRPVQLVGHNIGFDLGFLKQLAFLSGKDELTGASHRVLDTYTMLFLLHEKGLIPSSALTSDGAFRYFGIRISETQRHTALGDALATRDLFRAIFDKFDPTFGGHLSDEHRAVAGR